MRLNEKSLARLLVSLIVCSVVMLVGSLSPHSPVAQAYQAGNLLQNPGFEEPFIAVSGDQTLRVASGWQPWSLSQSGSSSINQRPEYKPAPSNRVRSGSAAQEYNTFFATHTGGVYQRVPVAAGTELRFSVFVYVWSSAPFANPDVSEDPNDVIINVGIDPNGGTDGTSSNIVWSSDAEYYDEYREMSVSARANGTAVTVFVRTAPQGFVGTNNVYLDDAVLIPLGTPQPPTVEQPTNTPDPFVPTQEGTITAIPVTPSPIPSFTPNVPQQPTFTPTPVIPSGFNDTVMYTVVAGDTVWDISRRYDSSVNAIIQVNGLNQNGFLRIGQALVVPVRRDFQQPPTLTPVPTQSSGTGGPVDTGAGTYVIVRGDTLTAIAARFNSTVTTLAQINNILNPNLIYPGQVLRVPGGMAPAPTPATPVPGPGGTLTHVVQPSENLFRIGLMYNVRWDVLAYANGIWNPNYVFPGQVLVIPR